MLVIGEMYGVIWDFIVIKKSVNLKKLLVKEENKKQESLLLSGIQWTP